MYLYASAVDMNDPTFWEKVLGAKPAQRLLTELTEGKLEAGSEEYIARFIGGALRDPASLLFTHLRSILQPWLCSPCVPKCF